MSDDPADAVRKESAADGIITQYEKPKVQIVKNDGFEVEIQWELMDPPPDYYTVKWSSQNGKEEEKVEGNSCLKKNLILGNSYSVIVAAMKDGILGFYSDNILFSAAPNPPQNVQLSLCETSPEDSLVVSYEDQPNVNRSYEIILQDLITNTSREPIVVENRLEETIGQLEAGHRYIAYVAAKYNEENCPLKSWQVSSKEITTCPRKVEGIEHEIRLGMHSIKWPAVPGCTSYEIAWFSKSTQIERDSTLFSNFTFPILKPGQEFQAYVIAVNISGKGKMSEPIHFKTAPSPPNNLQVTHHTSSPHTTLVFTFQRENISNILYKILVQPLSSSNTKTFEVENDKQFALIEDLDPGEEYELSITAKLEDLESDRAFLPEMVQMFPAKIEDLTASITNNKLKATWAPLTITPKHYVVIAKINQCEVIKVQTTKTTHVFSNLKPSSLYTIAVYAENGAGIGEETEFGELMTDPSPPENVRVTNNSWSPTTSLIVKYDDPDPGNKHYEITAYPSSGEKVEERSSENTVFLHGLTPGERYRVCVVAIFENDGRTTRSRPSYFPS